MIQENQDLHFISLEAQHEFQVSWQLENLDVVEKRLSELSSGKKQDPDSQDLIS